MKQLYTILCLCIAVVSLAATNILNRHRFADGFDAGRADVLRQMHNCISSNDSQWVLSRKRVYVMLNDQPIPESEYTNRFFTKWVLRVRQP